MRLGYVLCQVGSEQWSRGQWVDVATEAVPVDTTALYDDQVTGAIERMGAWATTRLADHRGENELFHVALVMLDENGEADYSLAEEYRVVSMGRAVPTGVLHDLRGNVEAALAWRAKRGLGKTG